MTKRPYEICWDPRVVRAAASVVVGIIDRRIDPCRMDHWAPVAQEATRGFESRPEVEVVKPGMGFGDDALGIGWHLPDGAVWLLVPDSGYGAGWTGPPQVFLEGSVIPAHAVVVLEAMARYLNVEP
jgi:hypothetical protein